MAFTTRRGGSVLEELTSSPGFLLALLGQDAMRRLRAALTNHNLKPRQFQLLDLLHDRGPISQRELGATMSVDHSVLVTLLNPLEADGLVSRTRDPGDRRRHVVTLTSSGKRQLDRAAGAQREAEDDVLSGLTTEQRDELRNLLIVLREAAIVDKDDCD